MTQKIEEMKSKLANGNGDKAEIQSKKPMNPYQNIQHLLEKMKGELAKALPKHITAERISRIALTEVRKNPDLLECSVPSLLGAIMVSAQLGLEPGILGHAYLIPYYNSKTRSKEVQFQIGYKGMIDLVRRSGEVRSLDAHEVCENDEFEYEYGINPILRHKPSMEYRGKPYCYYAVATFKDGGYAFLVMGINDVENYRRRSKSPDKGPWATDYDAMAKKTVIKQLCKCLPLSIEVMRGLVQDETTKKDHQDVLDAQDETDWIDITVPEAVSSNENE